MEEREGLRPLSVSRRETLETAVRSYEDALADDVEVVDYLLSRGLDEAAATTFRLGVVADPEPGHEQYRGMLAIPYLGIHSKPLTIRFRCLEQHEHRFHGKYNSMAEEPNRVYNVPAIHHADDEIHVTEGELDAIILTMLGLPAVAIPGANGFQPHHRRMLAGFSRAWVWGDPDEAGGRFVTSIERGLSSAVPIRLRREIGDVTETYLVGGEKAIYDLLNEGRGV